MTWWQFLALVLAMLACTAAALRSDRRTRRRLAEVEAAVMGQAEANYGKSLVVLGAMIDMAKSSRVSKREAELAKVSAETTVRTGMDSRAGEIRQEVREVPHRTAEEVVEKLREIDIGH